MNVDNDIYEQSVTDNMELNKEVLEILNRNLHEQKAMNWVLGEVIKVSSNLSSFVGLMEIITDMLMGVMGLDTCTIWIRQNVGFKCYSRSIYNENVFGTEDSTDLPQYFMRIKNPSLFNLDSDEYKFIRGKNVKSILLVPLDDFKNKNRIGVIVAEHHSKEYFTKSKMDFFYTLAIQISIASENAKLFEEERKKSEDEIKKKNDLIIENINYASVIQNSLLPDLSFIKKYAKDTFIIWKPRDIVGGDIYWFIPQKNGFCTAIIDCTGHGVSGAFVTIAVNQILNQILKEGETQSASEVLNKLNTIFRDTFYKFNNIEHFHAGLDIGICIVDKKLKKLIYSGAHISLFYYSKGELKEIRGINRSIGYGMERKIHKKPKEFTDIVIDYLPGDVFYMTTDGLIDQNGEENIYPYGIDNFIKVLENVNRLPFEKQKQKIWNSIDEYMGNEEQRDDITLIGIKPD
ncbi:GAF domain-containing SpoIIE family protein phosphatase [Clostridium thailandense]|uniref:GAF domain-containing SpoIIE family protein phosphatase n=1 Tax=Clostridium thailandense TaxID=2794346 RepID=UPI003988D9A6